MKITATFDPIEKTEDPLVVHGDGRGSLVILIHGLGGHRYRTWTPAGKLPAEIGLARFLFDDLKNCDVGLWAYRTLTQRVGWGKSIDLKDEARVLADYLRRLPENYSRIVLAGHSMGGLLSRAAVADLIKADEYRTLQRIKGLLMLATPMAGSLRVPSCLSWLSADLRALEAHGPFIREITEIFNDRVAYEEGRHSPRQFVIPTWALAAAEDPWVDMLSARLNIPRIYVMTVRKQGPGGAHVAVVKPADRSDEAYRWILTTLTSLLREDHQADLPSGPPAPKSEYPAAQRFRLPPVAEFERESARTVHRVSLIAFIVFLFFLFGMYVSDFGHRQLREVRREATAAAVNYDRTSHDQIDKDILKVPIPAAQITQRPNAGSALSSNGGRTPVGPAANRPKSYCFAAVRVVNDDRDLINRLDEQGRWKNDPLDPCGGTFTARFRNLSVTYKRGGGRPVIQDFSPVSKISNTRRKVLMGVLGAAIATGAVAISTRGWAGGRAPLLVGALAGFFSGLGVDAVLQELLLQESDADLAKSVRQQTPEFWEYMATRAAIRCNTYQSACTAPTGDPVLGDPRLAY